MLAAAVLFAGNMMAQNTLDNVEKLVMLGQDAKAKEALDGFLAVEKNAKKPLGWFYKGYIYNNLSRMEGTSPEQADQMKWDAFNAFKKYRELDPKAEKLEENKNAFLFDIYAGYLNDIGVRSYQEKKYNQATAYFARAVEVHDYIFKSNIKGPEGFQLSGFDTVAILYTAIAARDNKDIDRALAEFQKIVDANVSDKQYIDAYLFPAEHYTTKKDQAAFSAHLAKARKAMPDLANDWDEIEIDYFLKGKEEPEVFAAYEEVLPRFPNNFPVHFNYFVSMNRYIDMNTDDASKKAEVAALKAKLPAVAKKAIALKETIEGYYELGRFYYNNYFDIQAEKSKVKGTKPEDLKKKKDLETSALANNADAIVNLEKIEGLFAQIKEPKSSEKRLLKEGYKMLKTCYERKKDEAKTDYYDKKYHSAAD